MNHDDKKPRILITRLSALGDCILTLPLACAVRDHYPEAFVVWIVEPLAAKLITEHRAVDEFIVVPKGWFKSYARVGKLRGDLRAKRFDYVLDPQSLTKSSLLGWLSGAPRRIGFAAPRGRELATWLNNERVEAEPAHLVDATLKLLAPLGIQEPTVRFEVPAWSSLEPRIVRYARQAHLSEGYAVIGCGASWPGKRWPADRFGRVARHLGEQHGLTSVVTWADRQEADIAKQVVAKSGGHAILGPSTSLRELALLQRHASLVLGADTGPLHLAAAMGTPCLGLYGPTRAERSGPYGSRHAIIQSDAAPIRNRRRRRLDDSAMRRIQVESVCEACEKLLRRSGARAGWEADAA
ncbi:MAG: glycosyltransferase family 9 protein [Planctomycetota bacterium]